MTRTIHADLLAEQKKLSYRPAFQIAFSDNNLPHPSLIKTPLANYSANPSASVNTGTAIIRAHRVAGVGLQVQRITNPATTAQWESWTTLDANGNYPALFFTGSRVVLVYQNTSTYDIVYRYSDNDGQSWSGTSTLWAAAPFLLNNTQCGISAGASNSFFVHGDGANLLAYRYVQSNNTFDSSPPYVNIGGTVVSTSGVYIGNNEYRVAVVAIDYASWTDSAVVIQPFTWNGSTFTWGSRSIYIGIQGGTGATPAYAFNHVSLHSIGAWYWLTLAYSASTAGGALYNDNDTIIAVSNDATYFTAGLRINQSIADKLQAHLWSDGTIYLCSDKHLLKSTRVATVTAPTSHVKALDIHDIGPTAHAEIVLDNAAGDYDTLATGRLGCDITIERGALCDGSACMVARELFAAARFAHAADGKTVAVHAYNYYRLLELWRASFPYYYTNITLGTLVEAIAALAGLHATSLDSSSIWNVTLGEFLIPPGQSAAQALASLQDQFQFVTRMGDGATLQALTLNPSPTAAYSFGAHPTEHPTLRAEDSTERVAPDITHAEVIGSNAGAVAIATAIQFEMGRQFTHRITREVLTSNTDCATVASAITTKLMNSINRSEIVCLPAFHLQPFDAVNPPDGVTRYIASIRETYNPAALEHLPRRIKQVYRQTITLAAIAPAAGARNSVNTIVPEIWRRSEFRKGKLVSFDSTNWKALVWLDDTAGAVLLPVARHLHPATLVAGRRVAIIQFDTTNPADGLVVGVYSGTNFWQPFDRLYASDGSPAPAVYTDTTGRLRADYGLDVAGTLTVSSTANITGQTTISNNLILSGYLSLPEVSTPSAVAERALIYAADANSRTNLYARLYDAVRPITTGQAARVYHNANIAIPNNSATALTFNSERYDNDSIHDTSVNPGRLTCSTPGIYVITGCVRFSSNATGQRWLYIRHNASSTIGSVRVSAAASGETDLFVASIWSLNANDYLELVAWQNSGTTLNIVYAGGLSPEFAMIRIG